MGKCKKCNADEEYMMLAAKRLEFLNSIERENISLNYQLEVLRDILENSEQKSYDDFVEKIIEIRRNKLELEKEKVMLEEEVNYLQDRVKYLSDEIEILLKSYERIKNDHASYFLDMKTNKINIRFLYSDRMSLLRRENAELKRKLSKFMEV